MKKGVKRFSIISTGKNFCDTMQKVGPSSTYATIPAHGGTFAALKSTGGHVTIRSAGSNSSGGYGGSSDPDEIRTLQV